MNDRTAGLELSPLTVDNIHDLIPLYKAVFGKSTDREYLLAKYDTAYLGVTLFGHLAYEDGRPVAFHGAVPFAMEHDGRVEIAAQYGDAMTLRKYAGRGLFTTLGELTDRALEAAGVRFVYGFPNQNSEYGYLNKLHWKPVHRMRCFTLAVRTLPSEALSRAVGHGESFQNWLRQRFESMVVDGPLANSALEGGAVGTHRDERFFAYKSFTNNFVVDLDGCRMWIKPEGGLLIGDIECVSEDRVLAALDRLCGLARRWGLAKITFQASPGSRHERLFANRFEGIDSWVLGYKSFSSDFPLERLCCTYGDLDTF